MLVWNDEFSYLSLKASPISLELLEIVLLTVFFLNPSAEGEIGMIFIKVTKLFRYVSSTIFFLKKLNSLI